MSEDNSSSKRKQKLTNRSLSPEMKIHKKSEISGKKNSNYSSSSADKNIRSVKSVARIQGSILQYVKSTKTEKQNEECPQHNIVSNVQNPDSDMEVEIPSEENAGEDFEINSGDNAGEDTEIDSGDDAGEDVEIDSGNNASVDKKVKSLEFVTRPTFQVPLWMQKYFSYKGHVVGSKNQRDTIQMKCILCSSADKHGEIVGAPFSNFRRHLKALHSIEEPAGKDEKSLASSSTNVGTQNISSFFEKCDYKNPRNDNAYEMSHPVQSRFVTDLLDCIAIDLLSLDIMERQMFIKLVRHLNKHIRIFSRRTIGRRLAAYYEKKFKQKMKKCLEKLGPSSVHLIFDMWTDRGKNSVIGIKCQFISSDWKIYNRVLAFRHFPDRHIAANIRRIIIEVLKDTFSINPNKIGFSIGDNASNVQSTFMGEEDPRSNVVLISESTNEDDDTEWEDYDDYFDDDAEYDQESQYGRSEFDQINIELEDWTSSKIVQLPCFCHLIQLAIKDSIESHEVVANLVKDVKKVKKYFHTSTYWYQRFKKTAGKGLVHQADTRWNTIFYVFERLVQPKVREALDTILEQTRSTRNPCKVTFSASDYELMEVVSKLLQPLMELTNYLQSDGVTSSLVIPGVSCAYKAIATVDISDESNAKELQKALLHCLIQRFGCGALEKANSAAEKTRLNRIARNEVFANEILVVSSMLDPRIRDLPYKDKDDVLNNKHSSEVVAINTLEDKILQFKKTQGDVEVPSQQETTSTPPCRKTLFHSLSLAKTAKSFEESNFYSRSELQRYLEMPFEEENSNPLEFWKKNESSFPILSKLARIYLGIPASSGSAERLFSIAGALQRARRSRLKWSTIETLLCYRDARILQLYLKS